MARVFRGLNKLWGTMPGTPRAPDPRLPKTCIIGAGSSGIAVAKVFSAFGIPFDCFERSDRVGGNWVFKNTNGMSSTYRSLHINTSRGVTRFSDLDFDDATQVFPDHTDMHRYLVAYAQHFGVTPHIRFHSGVTQVRPAFDREREAPRWEVELATGAVEVFDSVIVASGHLTQPLDVPEFKAFTGEYLHAHHYKTPEPYVGKRICVVGVGNSACDIASDLCVTAKRCVLVASAWLEHDQTFALEGAQGSCQGGGVHDHFFGQRTDAYAVERGQVSQHGVLRDGEAPGLQGMVVDLRYAPRYLSQARARAARQFRE